jgi:error-prone DNA polymerase
MMAINGRVQHEGDVVHLVAQQLFDLSGNLSQLSDRDRDFKLQTRRGDEFAHGSLGADDGTPKPRDIFIRDFHIGTLKV